MGTSIHNLHNSGDCKLTTSETLTVIMKVSQKTMRSLVRPGRHKGFLRHDPRQKLESVLCLGQVGQKRFYKIIPSHSLNEQRAVL